MKKIIPIILLLFLLASCDKKDEPKAYSVKTNEKALVHDYEYAQRHYRNLLYELEMDIANSSISIPEEEVNGSQFIEFLVKLPVEDINKRLNKMKNSNALMSASDMYVNTLEFLTNATSIEEVEYFFNTMNEYVEKDRSSVQYLVDKSCNRPPIIQKYIMYAGAWIDLFRPPVVPNDSGELTCLEQLHRKVMEQYLPFMEGTMIIIDIGLLIPGIDVVSELLSVGIDYFSALELAAEYHDCLRYQHF